MGGFSQELGFSLGEAPGVWPWLSAVVNTTSHWGGGGGRGGELRAVGFVG